jgi:hypothetical protein
VERRRLVMEENKVMISAEEFDRLFDEGEVDVLQYMDMSTLHYPGREARTVAVDLPVRVFDALERESKRTQRPVEELIEDWVEDRLNAAAS